MLIVDAQVHIWSSGTPSGQHRQVSSYSAEECIAEMDAAGVNAVVLHPPGWDANGVEVAVAAATKYPDRFASLGHFPLDRPENRSLIDGWKSPPGMLGLRYAFTQPHQQNWMTDGTMDWLWPACEKAQIPVALMASNYLPQVGQIAERHPGLRLLLDHYARVRDASDDAAHGNQKALLGLAKIPECRGQGDRRARQFERALPLPQHPQIHRADLRRVRSGAHLLGHRHHSHAVLVAAMR